MPKATGGTLSPADEARSALPGPSQRLEALLDYETAAPYLSCTGGWSESWSRPEIGERPSREVGSDRARAIERYIEANRRVAVQ